MGAKGNVRSPGNQFANVTPVHRFLGFMDGVEAAHSICLDGLKAAKPTNLKVRPCITPC